MLLDPKAERKVVEDKDVFLLEEVSRNWECRYPKLVWSRISTESTSDNINIIAEKVAEESDKIVGNERGVINYKYDEKSSDLLVQVILFRENIRNRVQESLAKNNTSIESLIIDGKKGLFKKEKKENFVEFDNMDKSKGEVVKKARQDYFESLFDKDGEVEQTIRNAQLIADNVQVTQLAASNAIQNFSISDMGLNSLSSISSLRSSKARYSIPPTQLVCVFGEEHLKCLAKSISDFREASQQKELHIFDVQGFLGKSWSQLINICDILMKEKTIMPGMTCVLKSIKRFGS